MNKQKKESQVYLIKIADRIELDMVCPNLINAARCTA